MPRKYVNFKIRGVTYADVNAASKVLGVHPVSIRKHLRDGTTDRCGCGLSGPPPMPVMVRGKRFVSAQAAADYFGVSRDTVYRKLAQGRADDIGRPNRRGMHCAVPFEIGPLRFASVSAASRALGFKTSYLHRARHGGGALMWQRVLAAAMRLAEQQNAETPRQDGRAA